MADPLDLSFQLLQVAGTTLGRGIAAVQQTVDTGLFDPLLLGKLNQGIEVTVVGMDPAV